MDPPAIVCPTPFDEPIPLGAFPVAIDGHSDLIENAEWITDGEGAQIQEGRGGR